MVAEKNMNDKKALEIKAENEKSKRNMIIASLILLFAAIFFWLNARRKQEKLIEAQKQQRAEELLAQANRQLDQFLSNIIEKNELLEKMSTQLEEANRTSPELALKTKEYLETLQNSVILTEENWAAFKKLFDQVFPNFFGELTTKYKDLSPAEIRLLALQKLNLPTKAMANMLGISAESIRKSRYRLRKKYPELLDEASTLL